MNQHEWVLNRSWWGDQNVIDGTQDYNVWQCVNCGAEDNEREETLCTIGEIDMSNRFPVGGERQKVYDFMKDHGFLMSKHSDKCWLRADGVEAHIYGTGSMARIFNREGEMLHDDELDKAVEAVRWKQTT